MDAELYREYSTESTLLKAELELIWKTAIGLQDVDHLRPSAFLLETAEKNINGDILLSDACRIVEASPEPNEADIVSARIAMLLSENTFCFSPASLQAIHKHLFFKVIPAAGTFRKVNISKKEWVLNGSSVMYGDAYYLEESLSYDFSREKDYDYSGKSMSDTIHHLAAFIAGIWQIHPFPEGNTRTAAVFLILYLRTLGFKHICDTFEEHSWYFRNALVRANYSNLPKDIFRTTEYLELFLRNLLLGEQNELKNRYLHITQPCPL